MEVLINEPLYSAIFIGVGLFCLFLEVFVPSGGILGLLFLGCAGFGVYGLFHQGRTFLGVSAIAGTAVAILLGIRFGLYRLSFRGSLPPETFTSVDPGIASLQGKKGVAITPLRPAGIALIEGKRVDVVTRGTFVAKDTEVCVVETTGNWVVVRPVEPPSEDAKGKAPGGAA